MIVTVFQTRSSMCNTWSPNPVVHPFLLGFRQLPISYAEVTSSQSLHRVINLIAQRRSVEARETLSTYG